MLWQRHSKSPTNCKFLLRNVFWTSLYVKIDRCKVWLAGDKFCVKVKRGFNILHIVPNKNNLKGLKLLLNTPVITVDFVKKRIPLFYQCTSFFCFFFFSFYFYWIVLEWCSILHKESNRTHNLFPGKGIFIYFEGSVEDKDINFFFSADFDDGKIPINK